ncbi:MAG: hypothetical protein WDM90_14955 [Ferruginibacter sp.]
MSTALIASWVYTKGELGKKKLDSWMVGIAAIIALALTFTFVWPLLQTNIPFTGKISNFIFIIVLFIIGIVVYYILSFFSGSIYFVYKKITGIKEEEILFTANKITSTNKTWILNDDIKKLVSVKFDATKNKELVFKGTETKPGKTAINYTISIPVPANETANAEKVYAYFKSNLL